MTTTEEVRMTIKTLAGRQVPQPGDRPPTGYDRRQRSLSSAPYGHRGRGRAHPPAPPGRGSGRGIALWRTGREDEPVNLADLHDWLVREHGYTGSLRSVQRYSGRTIRGRANGPGAASRPRPAPRPRWTGRVPGEGRRSRDHAAAFHLDPVALPVPGR